MNKSGLSPIETTVQQHLGTYFKNQGGVRFVIGVSGGMDSMALLHVFHRLNIAAHVVHLNYKKRGTASDKDAELVTDVCQQWDFDCAIYGVDPAGAEGENFQQWARDKRYHFFEEIMEVQQADGIAIAHHCDDQVETVIQKIFRGAGLASWSGMKVWDGKLFRPFLGFSREQVAEYVEENSIPYRTDQSNLESDFARNFLRNEWLAELSDFFPGWEQNVLQVAEQAENFDQSIDWISNRITQDEKVDREEFHSLALGVQKAVILHLLKKRDPDTEITKPALNQLDQLPCLQTGKAIQLTEEYFLLRDRDQYVVINQEKKHFGAVKLHQEDITKTVDIAGFLEFSVEACASPYQEDNLYLDMAKLSWPLTLRRWQQGDRFQPLGMEGHQLVSDHLTNRKISTARRYEALVIESFEETICAVIFPPIKNRDSVGTISDHVKWEADTVQCMKITYSKKV
ncbi:tRNA lysidine(34) synthetase TilS [Fodinibius salsisoli]|uniref:tRNA(Ile)-lysidine synthase n=1 Tax=Fodinibius salsisoli TaxID=2820877 RepID=A0ABT3PRS1_9BACT|nr:tRNA lysidine(34) synthetase TilS [Fodinibius salsisoli]MCW9708525.1 tRNA lysidine(34) synthetase TilS [Fodinibius salsisoli]